MRMKSILTGSALLFALAGSAGAQGLSMKEIRLNVANLGLDPTRFGVDFPSSASVGLFFNEKVALEPSVSFYTTSGYNAMGLGAGLAYYFAGDHGKAGLFVAPTMEYYKSKGSEKSFDYGADVGYKMAMRDNFSLRLAGTARDGDSYADMSFGVSLGFSFYINK